MQHQKPHKGNILEKAVRQSGYPITKVAERLGITRTTLYNKFGKPDLPSDFLIHAGEVIYYDFSIDLPELSENIRNAKEKRHQNEKETFSLLELQKKYSDLLENYTRLTSFLINITNENQFYTLKKR